MVQSSQTASANRRRRFWTQLFVFLALAALLYAKPKVEAWLERQQNASPSVADDNSSGSGSPSSKDAAPHSEWKSPISKKKSSTTSGDKSDQKETQTAATDDDQVVDDATKADTTGAASDAALTESATPPKSASKKSAASTKTKSPKDSKPEDPKPEDSQAEATAKTEPAAPPKTQVAKKKAEPKKQAAPDDAESDKPAKSKSPAVVKMDRPQTKPRTVPSDAEKNNPPPSEKKSPAEPQLGKLKEVANNVFESTAGLIYEPGSADGHRLKHVMEHAKDNLQKPIHGVFDGDRDEILATIDEAYMKAKKGGSDVRSERQNDRQVYTVNLKRRIGQMGGSEGERKGNPECRYLRMVLENGNEIVSAYPTKSF